MATTQGTEARIAPSKIKVQNSNGSLIRKAAELSDEEGKNKVTLACVQSLGHSTTTTAGNRDSEIELTWGPADGISTDEDLFEIVATATLAHDFKLNDAASTRLLEARRGPSSFPCFPKKVENEDKAERERADAEYQRRQQEQREREQQEAREKLRKSRQGPHRMK